MGFDLRMSDNRWNNNWSFSSKFIFLSLIMAFYAVSANAQTNFIDNIEVKYCYDGDTCKIITSQGLWLNVRLFGIDAQENIRGKIDLKNQPFAIPARDALNRKVKDCKVNLIQADRDRHNRPIVEIWYNNRNINLEMIKEGWAEAYRGKTKRINMGPYFSAENEAKSKKLGIWNLKNYISPREFRKVNKQKI